MSAASTSNSKLVSSEVMSRATLYTKNENAHFVPRELKGDFNRTMSSIVAYIEGEKCFGTGFVVTGGLLVTCAHVTNESKLITIMLELNNRVFYSKKILEFKECDVAIVEVDWGDYQPEYGMLKVDYMDSCSLGTEVYGIGHPHRLRFSFLTGKLCLPATSPCSLEDAVASVCFYNKCHGVEDDAFLLTAHHFKKSACVQVIQNLDAASGASGSPVFDPQGMIIGMSSFAFGERYFAIHSWELDRVLNIYRGQGSAVSTFSITRDVGGKVCVYDENPNEFQLEFYHMTAFYERMREVVVTISYNEGAGYGSGVIIEGGHVLTASNIFDDLLDDDRIQITRFGDPTLYTVENVIYDRSNDLAMVFVNWIRNQQKICEFAQNNDHLSVGTKLYCICHPYKIRYCFLESTLCHPKPRLGSQFIGTVGIDDSSAGGQPLEKYKNNISSGLLLLQLHSLFGCTGCKGAPLFDSKGRVVGIHSWSIVNFDFAISIDPITSFLKGLKKEEKSALRNENESNVTKESNTAASWQLEAKKVT